MEGWGEVKETLVLEATSTVWVPVGNTSHVSGLTLLTIFVLSFFGTRPSILNMLVKGE